MLVVIMVLLSGFNFRLNEMKSRRTESHIQYAKTEYNAEQYRKLDELLPQKNVILNTKFRAYVDVMFYSQHLGYDGLDFTREQLQKIKDRGYPVAMFRPKEKQQVPEYFFKEFDVRIIDLKLKGK